MRRDIIQRVASSAGAHPKIPAPQLCHISSVCDGGAVGLASCSGQRSLTAATPACRGGHRWGRGEAGEGRGLCRPRQPGAPVHVALWTTPCQVWHHQALGRKGLCSQRPLHAPSPAPPELVTGRVGTSVSPVPGWVGAWAAGAVSAHPPSIVPPCRSADLCLLHLRCCPASHPAWLSPCFRFSILPCPLLLSAPTSPPSFLPRSPPGVWGGRALLLPLVCVR